MVEMIKKYAEDWMDFKRGREKKTDIDWMA